MSIVCTVANHHRGTTYDIAMKGLIRKCRQFFDTRIVIELAFGLFTKAFFAGVKVGQDTRAASVQPKAGLVCTVTSQQTRCDCLGGAFVIRGIGGIYHDILAVWTF